MNEAGASNVAPDDSSAGDPTSDLPAPDWYPDPWDPDRSLRWWDGAEWTGHTAELAAETGGSAAAEDTPDAQGEPAEPSPGDEEPASSQVEAEEPADFPAGDEEPAGLPVGDEEPARPVLEDEEPAAEAERPAEPVDEPDEPVEPVVDAEAPPAERVVEPDEPVEPPVEPEVPAEPVPPAPAAQGPEGREAQQWSPEAQDDSTGAPPGWEDRPRVMVHGEQPQAEGGIPREVAWIAAAAVFLVVLLLVLLG